MTLSKTIKILFVLQLLFLLCSQAYSQTQDEVDDPAIVIGGVSPIILATGQVEITNSAFLVSYWNKLRVLDLSGGAFNNTYRLSQFQNTTSIYYGFSESRRWDIGVDVTYAKQRWDDVARSSPFKVLSGDDLNKSGISYLGLKFRAQPFAGTPELTLQTTIRLPIANGNELRRDLSAESAQFSIFSSYYKSAGISSSFLLQGGWLFTLPKTIDETNSIRKGLHVLSLGGYLAFDFSNRMIYLIPGLSYSGSFQKSAKSSRILQRTHSVLGNLVVQFQFNDQLSLSLQQTYPLLFESYIPNLEYERRSFYSSALVFRILI